MAIAHRATGTAVFGINNISPAVPAGHLAGDMMLLLVGGKPFNAGESVSTEGWARLGTVYTNGTTAAGNDVGSVMVTAYWKEATSDTEASPTVTEGSPTFNIMGGIVVVFSKEAGDAWDTPVICGGGDSSATGTGVSITCDVDPDIVAGDHTVSFIAYKTDSNTPCTSHTTPTAAGVTFTNTHDPATDPETTSGGDMGLCVTRSTVTGDSTAPPVLSATVTNGTSDGTGALIRLRRVDPPAGNAQVMTIIAGI